MDQLLLINRLPLEVRRLVSQEVADGILNPYDLKDLALTIFPMLDVLDGHHELINAQFWREAAVFDADYAIEAITDWMRNDIDYNATDVVRTTTHLRWLSIVAWQARTVRYQISHLTREVFSSAEYSALVRLNRFLGLYGDDKWDYLAELGEADRVGMDEVLDKICDGLAFRFRDEPPTQEQSNLYFLYSLDPGHGYIKYIYIPWERFTRSGLYAKCIKQFLLTLNDEQLYQFFCVSYESHRQKGIGEPIWMYHLRHRTLDVREVRFPEDDPDYGHIVGARMPHESWRHIPIDRWASQNSLAAWNTALYMGTRETNRAVSPWEGAYDPANARLSNEFRQNPANVNLPELRTRWIVRYRQRYAKYTEWPAPNLRRQVVDWLGQPGRQVGEILFALTATWMVVMLLSGGASAQLVSNIDRARSNHSARGYPFTPDFVPENAYVPGHHFDPASPFGDSSAFSQASGISNSVYIHTMTAGASRTPSPASTTTVTSYLSAVKSTVSESSLKVSRTSTTSPHVSSSQIRKAPTSSTPLSYTSSSPSSPSSSPTPSYPPPSPSSPSAPPTADSASQPSRTPRADDVYLLIDRLRCAAPVQILRNGKISIRDGDCIITKSTLRPLGNDSGVDVEKILDNGSESAIDVGDGEQGLTETITCKAPVKVQPNGRVKIVGHGDCHIDDSTIGSGASGTLPEDDKAVTTPEEDWENSTPDTAPTPEPEEISEQAKETLEPAQETAEPQTSQEAKEPNQPISGTPTRATSKAPTPPAKPPSTSWFPTLRKAKTIYLPYLWTLLTTSTPLWATCFSAAWLNILVYPAKLRNWIGAAGLFLADLLVQLVSGYSGIRTTADSYGMVLAGAFVTYVLRWDVLVTWWTGSRDKLLASLDPRVKDLVQRRGGNVLVVYAGAKVKWEGTVLWARVVQESLALWARLSPLWATLSSFSAGTVVVAFAAAVGSWFSTGWWTGTGLLAGLAPVCYVGGAWSGVAWLLWSTVSSSPGWPHLLNPYYASGLSLVVIVLRWLAVQYPDRTRALLQPVTNTVQLWLAQFQDLMQDLHQRFEASPWWFKPVLAVAFALFAGFLFDTFWDSYLRGASTPSSPEGTTIDNSVTGYIKRIASMIITVIVAFVLASSAELLTFGVQAWALMVMAFQQPEIRDLATEIYRFFIGRAIGQVVDAFRWLQGNVPWFILLMLAVVVAVVTIFNYHYILEWKDELLAFVWRQARRLPWTQLISEAASATKQTVIELAIRFRLQLATAASALSMIWPTVKSWLGYPEGPADAVQQDDGSCLEKFSEGVIGFFNGVYAQILDHTILVAATGVVLVACLKFDHIRRWTAISMMWSRQKLAQASPWISAFWALILGRGVHNTVIAVVLLGAYLLILWAGYHALLEAVSLLSELPFKDNATATGGAAKAAFDSKTTREIRDEWGTTRLADIAPNSKWLVNFAYAIGIAVVGALLVGANIEKARFCITWLRRNWIAATSMLSVAIFGIPAIHYAVWHGILYLEGINEAPKHFFDENTVTRVLIFTIYVAILVAPFARSLNYYARRSWPWIKQNPVTTAALIGAAVATWWFVSQILWIITVHFEEFEGADTVVLERAFIGVKNLLERLPGSPLHYIIGALVTGGGLVLAIYWQQILQRIWTSVHHARAATATFAQQARQVRNQATDIIWESILTMASNGISLIFLVYQLTWIGFEIFDGSDPFRTGLFYKARFIIFSLYTAINSYVFGLYFIPFSLLWVPWMITQNPVTPVVAMWTVFLGTRMPTWLGQRMNMKWLAIASAIIFTIFLSEWIYQTVGQAQESWTPPPPPPTTVGQPSRFNTVMIQFFREIFTFTKRVWICATAADQLDVVTVRKGVICFAWIVINALGFAFWEWQFLGCTIIVSLWLWFGGWAILSLLPIWFLWQRSVSTPDNI